MFNIILSNCNIQLGGLNDKVVWDMFAGIGTDSIRLARHAGKVIATEINKETFNCLKKNTETSGLKNLQIVNRDCCEYKQDQNQSPDVIYFDPPWGDTFQSGQPFSFSDVSLTNGCNVIDLLKNVQARYSEAYLLIKAPYMCDIEKFIAEESVLAISSFSRQKLKYVLCRAK
jgi:predicted RNA methylase